MNKIRKTLLALVALVALVAFVAVGQVLNLLPVPATWAAANGNYFRLNSSAVPELQKAGTALAGIATNTFTGATATIPLTNGIVLQFVNGVYVGTNAP